MAWQKKIIPVQTLEGLFNTFKVMIDTGDERLKDMRCIYTIDDTNMTYVLTVFDFMDLNPIPDIKSFSLGQMVKN